MITDAGGLTVRLKPTEVTWFRFLQASRATNSLEEGWNSRTHWGNKGLFFLSSRGAPFLQQWTANSLKKTANPGPRTDKFMFDRQLSKERKELVRNGKLTKNAFAVLSENEINARLFHHHPQWQNCIGYEIPLAKESDGQLKVDIIAIEERNCSLVIIELKQANNTSDSPLMALTEAICYGIQAIRCREHLLKESGIKKKGESGKYFNSIRLLLAAPRQYWKTWGWNKEEMVKPMWYIVSQVNEALPAKTQLIFDEQSICFLEDCLPE